MKFAAAKGSVFLFLLYLLWYTETKGHVSLFLYGGAALITITTLIYINGRTVSLLFPPKGILFGAGYGVYSLVTGIVVAANKGVLVSSLITYFAFLFVCYCIAIICLGERDVSWLLKIIAAVCVLCAIYTLFWGYRYKNEVYVTTMGPENNPNRLGALMVFGMFAVLYRNERSFGKLLVTCVLSVLFIYVIILSGSRKALISAIALGGFWFVTFLRDTWKKCERMEQVKRLSLAAIMLGIAVAYFTNTYLETASFERFLRLFAENGTSSRWAMYVEAAEMFKKSMLFGVGFDQYRILHFLQTYSHSTYAEVLACGGILGCLIYFSPIIWTGCLVYKRLKKEKSYSAGMLFALYTVEMFLGAVNIFMYTFMHIMVWTILYVLTENEDIYCLEDRFGSGKNVKDQKVF